MTGGGDRKDCRKALSQKPSHLAHNHTMTFEVYIHLSYIRDVQLINVSVMQCPTEPDLKRELKSRAITELKKREMHRARQQSSGASSVPATKISMS